MEWTNIIMAAGMMLVLAMLIGYVLGWANRFFFVKVDERIEQVIAALPAANCGGCGFAGCAAYAEAVVLSGAPLDKCGPGGSDCVAAIAKIMGVEAGQSFPYRAVVHCGAHTNQRLGRNEYRGEPTCRSANIISGVQGCTYGCLGIGDCSVSCPFDAIKVIDGLATVDYKKCTGCGNCEHACPRHIISMVPFKSERMLVVTCSNKDFGKDVKAVCKVGCIGCGLCQRTSELFKVSDNLPSVNYDKYDPATSEQQLQAAASKCPQKRLLYIGMPSEKDLAAVADQEVPKLVEAKFETTVDKTEWQG